MRQWQVLLLSATLTVLGGQSSAQTWSGVLDPSRAIDWSSAGVPGGIPSGSWTQCGATIGAYTGAASTITSALSGCPANSYVKLGPGTFTITSGTILLPSTGKVALRGSGAQSTFLVISGTAQGACSGVSQTAVCMKSSDGTYAGQPPSTVYNWTAGYAQGATQITLSSVANITLNSTMIFLDQCEDGYSGSPCAGSAIDTGGFYVCGDQYSSPGHGCSAEGNDGGDRHNRGQIEIVVATAINQGGCGATCVTISPPLKHPQWRTSQTPQAWLIQPVRFLGIEELSIDTTGSNATSTVEMYNCYGCWAYHVAFTNIIKWAVNALDVAHTQVDSCYLFGQGTSDSYGIRYSLSADTLNINNIIRQNRSPIVFDGPDTGSVTAYNFQVRDFIDSDSMFQSNWNHSQGDDLNLWEGNVGAGFANDIIHGSHMMITRFRNYYYGWEPFSPGKDSQTQAIGDMAYSRYSNILGNVLGTAGYHTVYQDTTGNTALSVYYLGPGNPAVSPQVPSDPLVLTTSYRWGNWDVVTNGVRWCGNSNSPGWATTCASKSEVPAGLTQYANAVPGTQTLPASFFLSAKPSWWGSRAWPAIGPDVSNGNVGVCSGGTFSKMAASSAGQCSGGSLATGLGGHVSLIPAMDCYLNVMGGPPDGTGGVLVFNPNTCYAGGNGGTPTAPPTLLTTSNVK